MWYSIIPLETTTSFTRHIIICNAVTFPNQVVGGRESLLNKGNFFIAVLLVWSLGSGTICVPGSSGHAFSTTALPWMTLTKKLIRMCLGITDPMMTPLKASSGQTLNSGGHDGLECHLVPLPTRLNRKHFRELIGKCCTVFAITRHSRCDAAISFIWTTSSRRSDSQVATTQCIQKLEVQAVMTIFGKSLTTDDLWVHIFEFFWNHFRSWNTMLYSPSLFRTYSISQGLARVCPFAILVLVWPFANFLMAQWLEIDPSASEQFWLHDPSGPNAERFIDFWALTYFWMATGSPLAVHCSLEANFQQLFCRVVDFMFQQVVLQDRRELQRSSEIRALHDWFCVFGNCHIVHKLQTVRKFSQWSQTSNHPGLNGSFCQPTDSGNIPVWGLYRTVCEWGTIHWVTILRSWFDIHSACSQFVRPNSGRFLARLQPRCEIFLTMLGHLAGTFFPFSFTHDSVVDKVICMDCGCSHRYTFTKRLVGQRFSLQRWAILCFMSLQLADGANPGPDCFGSADECLWPGRDPSANNSTSMSWLLPVLCSAVSLFATWVLRKWWIFFAASSYHGGS